MSEQDGMASLDLGILAAKMISEKLDAEVIDYSTHKSRTTVRIRIPSRAERFRRAMDRSRRLVAESSLLTSASRDAHSRTAFQIDRIEHRRAAERSGTPRRSQPTDNY